MKLSARSAALYSVLLVGLLALSACGKNEQQSANQPASPSTAPAPSSTAAAKPAPATTAPAPAHAGTAAPAPAAPAAASTAVATPATNDSFQVSSVTLGDSVNSEHQVRKDMATFTPNEKTLYVSVDTTGSTQGATLNAKWSYLEGNGQEVMSTSQSIIADGPATTTFRVQNPNLWPAGKYKVDISVDGKQAASKTFEVKKS